MFQVVVQLALPRLLLPLPFTDEALAAFQHLTTGHDLCDPSVRAQVCLAFQDHAAWFDVEAHLPPSPSWGFPPLPSALPGLSPPSSLPIFGDCMCSFSFSSFWGVAFLAVLPLSALLLPLLSPVHWPLADLFTCSP